MHYMEVHIAWDSSICLSGHMSARLDLNTQTSHCTPLRTELTHIFKRQCVSGWHNGQLSIGSDASPAASRHLQELHLNMLMRHVCRLHDLRGCATLQVRDHHGMWSVRLTSLQEPGQTFNGGTMNNVSCVAGEPPLLLACALSGV